MKNNNTLILIGAALLYYWWMKNKKTAVLPEQITETLQQATGSGQIQLIRSQTVNFEQLAPTPSSILDLPGSKNPAYSACNCCNNGRLSGMPVVC